MKHIKITCKDPVILLEISREVLSKNFKWKFQSNSFLANAPFYTPWNNQKTEGFMVFSGGMKSEHWTKMGQILATNDKHRGAKYKPIELILLVNIYYFWVFQGLNSGVNKMLVFAKKTVTHFCFKPMSTLTKKSH